MCRSVASFHARSRLSFPRLCDTCTGSRKCFYDEIRRLLPSKVQQVAAFQPTCPRTMPAPSGLPVMYRHLLYNPVYVSILSCCAVVYETVSLENLAPFMTLTTVALNFSSFSECIVTVPRSSWT